MYAVVRTGGKQYKVEPGTVFDVELLTAEVGEGIEFSEVLLVADGEQVTVGRPLVAGAAVKGTIVEHVKAAKRVIFKKVKRQDHRLKKGHRQKLTRVRIESIVAA